MKNLNCIILLISILFSGFVGFSQTDCESIQCDCENIPDVEKDPGLIALCKYYEKALIERCKEGEKNLKCKDNAKGPKTWVSTKSSSNNTVPKSKDEVDISNIKDINSIRYCNQLLAYVRQKGYQFGNVRVPADVNLEGYFKEGWAYDINGNIYVLAVRSKQMNSGYAYMLTANRVADNQEYEFHVFCNIKGSDWKKFSAPCEECDYDERFKNYIQKNECDCL